MLKPGSTRRLARFWGAADPQLFTQQGALVWTLIASLYIGNVILLSW